MIFRFLRKIIKGYRALHWTERTVLWGMVIIAALILLPHYLTERAFHPQSGAAQIYLAEPPTNIHPGQTFDLEVRMSSRTRSVNAAQFQLVFNPAILEVLTMTTTESFCSFYAANSFDTIKGEVEVACGTPNPGFTGDSVLAKITMRANTAGETSLTLNPDKTMVLANDGKGTNLVKDLDPYSLVITPSF